MPAFEIPQARRRQRLLGSCLLSLLVAFLAYAHQLPGLPAISLLWSGATAAALTLVLWVGPARHYLNALVHWSVSPYQIPERLVALAALALYGLSLIRWAELLLHPAIEDIPTLHFHSASLLLTLDMLLRHALTWCWAKTRIEGGRDTRFTRAMIRRLQETQESYSPLLKKSEASLLPLYISLGSIVILTIAAWLSFAHSIDGAVTQGAALLVIAAPWAYLFGLPDTFRIGVRAAAYRNVLLSSHTIIEFATQLDALIFGKRDTLTQGSPRVTDIIPMSDIDEEELLLWAASAEHDSKHPFGQAIVAEATAQSIPLEPPERFTELTGMGVECVIDGQLVRLGKSAFFAEHKIPAYLADRITQLAHEGKTPFLCSRDNQCLGIIAVTEELRPEAAEVIERIRRMGLQTILLTGDDQMLAESLAERLHIDRVIAEVLPDQKTKEINRLRREGFRIGMVGNFREDAECLTESDIGITLTRGEGIELPPADVILIENNLKHVVTLLHLSRRIFRTARENRFFTHVYHPLALVWAAGILVPFGFAPVSPVIASLVSWAWTGLIALNNRRLSPSTP